MKEEPDEINLEEHLEVPAEPQGTGQSREEGEDTGPALGGTDVGGRESSPRKRDVMSQHPTLDLTSGKTLRL